MAFAVQSLPALSGCHANLQQPTVVTPSVSAAIFHTEGAMARTALGTFAFMLGLQASRSHRSRKVQVKSRHSDGYDAAGSDGDGSVCVQCGKHFVGHSRVCPQCLARIGARPQLAQQPPAPPQLGPLERPTMLDEAKLSHPGFNPQPLTTKNETMTKNEGSPKSENSDSQSSDVALRDYQQGGIKAFDPRTGLEGQLQIRHMSLDDRKVWAGKVNVGSKDVKVGVGASFDGQDVKGMCELKAKNATVKATDQSLALQLEFDGPVPVDSIRMAFVRLLGNGARPDFVCEGKNIIVVTPTLKDELRDFARDHCKGSNKSRLKLQVSVKGPEVSRLEIHLHKISSDGTRETSSIEQVKETSQARDATVTAETGFRAEFDVGLASAYGETGVTINIPAGNIHTAKQKHIDQTAKIIEHPDATSERIKGGTRTTEEVVEIIVCTEKIVRNESLFGQEMELIEETLKQDQQIHRHQKMKEDYDLTESGSEEFQESHGPFYTSSTVNLRKKAEKKSDLTLQTVSTSGSGEESKPTTQVHKKVQDSAVVQVSLEQRTEESGIFKTTAIDTCRQNTRTKTTTESTGEMTTSETEHIVQERTVQEETDCLLLKVQHETRETKTEMKETKNGKVRKHTVKEKKKDKTTISLSEHAERGAQSAAHATAATTGRAIADLIQTGETSVTPEEAVKTAADTGVRSTCHSIVQKAATQFTNCRHTGAGLASGVVRAFDQKDRLLGASQKERDEAVVEVVKDGALSYAVSQAPKAMGAKCAGGAGAAVEGVLTVVEVSEKLAKGDGEGAGKAALKGGVKTAIAFVTASLGPFGLLLGAAASAAVDSVEL